MVEILVLPKEGEWRNAIALLEQEYRRTLEYGFSESEVAEAAAALLNEYEQKVLEESSVTSADLANEIYFAVRTDRAGSVFLRDCHSLRLGLSLTLLWHDFAMKINGRKVMSSPDENLRIATLALSDISAEEAHQAFLEVWNGTESNVYFATSSELFLNGTTDEAAIELCSLYSQSTNVQVDPPREEAAVAFKYTDFGEKGSILNDNFVQDLEIRQISLTNGIRVNMKQTDFESGSISFTARFGNGQLSQPKKPYLNTFADLVLEFGGL